MGQRFVACDREQSFLMPPDVREWLPEGHLAWFVIDAVGEMDLDAFYAVYRRDGRSRPPYDPAMMVALLLYAYARGTRATVAHRDRDRERLADRRRTGWHRHGDAHPGELFCGWKAQRAPASIAGAAQVRRLVGDSRMCRDVSTAHRNANKTSALQTSPYDALLLLLDAAARLRVIGLSRHCSDSSDSAASGRAKRCARTAPLPRSRSLAVRSWSSSFPRASSC